MGQVIPRSSDQYGRDGQPVPLTQEETFALEEGDSISLDVRAAFADGSVVGTKVMQKIKVLDALSEEEL